MKGLLLLSMPLIMTLPLSRVARLEAQGWSLTGNAGTNPSANYLGTTDNQPLVIKVNGLEVARYLSGTGVKVQIAGPITTTNNVAIHGVHSTNTAGGHGVFGSSNGCIFPEGCVEGAGVHGINTASGAGVSGFSAGIGVYGSSSGAGVGVVGDNQTGVAVRGNSISSTGVEGSSHGGVGVRGSSNTNNGVMGVSFGSGASGVYGENSDGFGVAGRATRGGTGVFGHAPGTGTGVLGDSRSANGVFGRSASSGASGVYGENNSGGYGVAGRAGSSGTGVLGDNPGGAGWAGYFNGKVRITGLLQKGGGGFVIDHPLDPANKYLHHSFVESPDMKNMYDGVTALDAAGEAWIVLPVWFEAVNRDFRYQLTCVGAYAPVYVAEEIRGNRFKIAGGTSGLKVSWQVTGTRRDPFAEKNRLPVEEEKPLHERGKYLDPQVYGKPITMGADFETGRVVTNQSREVQASRVERLSAQGSGDLPPHK